MIVDDQPMVRSGLSAFLSVADDFELVGEAETGSRLCGCATHSPTGAHGSDDARMDGVAVTRAILSVSDVRIIALTSFPQDQLVQRYFRRRAELPVQNVGVEELA
jgi:NarL family two-component system response regulator LiaR